MYDLAEASCHFMAQSDWDLGDSPSVIANQRKRPHPVPVRLGTAGSARSFFAETQTEAR
jgi:hypothetical protein